MLSKSNNMACLIDPKNVVEVAYHLQCGRDSILKLNYKLPLSQDWYTAPVQKAINDQTQDENYNLTLTRYVLKDGTTTGWIACPLKTDIHAKPSEFDEVELPGKVVLKLIYDIYQNGDTVDDGAVDLF